MHAGPLRSLVAGQKITWHLHERGLKRTVSVDYTGTYCGRCSLMTTRDDSMEPTECVPLCCNCLGSKDEHPAGCCLFRPTKYEPVAEGMFDR